MKRTLLVGTILFGLFFSCATTRAQTTDATDVSALWNTVIERTVFLTVLPENPRAHESISLTATSYNTDINRATIVWTVNGKVAKRGIGEKVLTVTMGGAGTKTVISADITTFEGALINKSVTFIPQEVDIVWQTNAYVPPFYKGKALLPMEGDMTVTAIPNFITGTGTVIPADKLLYTWSKNGDIQGNLSGYGKNKINLTQSIITRSTEVEVKVTNLEKTMVANKTITITPQDSTLLLYENNPLYGPLFNKALMKSTVLESDELSILAIPLFFSALTRDDSQLQYNWRMNNISIPQQKNPSIITVRKPTGASGSSFINISVVNTDKIFQSINNAITLTYNKTQNETF
ncbi:MAG: hypothetical protein WC757_01600 [Candidatus Paceibacterota bacterium]|jgi:hypothetical protein